MICANKRKSNKKWLTKKCKLGNKVDVKMSIYVRENVSISYGFYRGLVMWMSFISTLRFWPWLLQSRRLWSSELSHRPCRTGMWAWLRFHMLVLSPRLHQRRPCKEKRSLWLIQPIRHTLEQSSGMVGTKLLWSQSLQACHSSTLHRIFLWYRVLLAF